MDALTVRRFLADPDMPGSFADRARRARRQRLLAAFPAIEQMTVLDLGGTVGYWRHLDVAPADLTLVNIADRGGPSMRMIVGDACDPPSGTFDRAYDLVMCNSVIDQVGGLSQRQQIAAVIMRAAPRYWVQVANRGFPVDAYFLFPWFARLPVRARVAVLRRWPVTPMHTVNPVEARERVLAIELQSRRDLRGLFPAAELVTERFAGFAKSLIAIKG